MGLKYKYWKIREEVPLYILEREIVREQELEKSKYHFRVWGSAKHRSLRQVHLNLDDKMILAELMFLNRNLPHKTLDDGRLNSLMRRQGGMVHKALWVPYPAEMEECCLSHSLPRGYGYNKWSLYIHCGTIKHIATKFNVPSSQLRETLKLYRPLEGICALCLKEELMQNEGVCPDCYWGSTQTTMTPSKFYHPKKQEPSIMGEIPF